MANKLFYETYSDVLLEPCDIERAFYITFGKHRSDSESEYLRYLYSLFGKSIKKAVRLSVEDLLHRGHKIMAIKLYRDINNCSLAEAKNAVDRMEET